LTAPPGPAWRGLRRAVLCVGRSALRPLPWRATRDPWAVLVSEVMLQQTQAHRVAPVYERFMAQFPTPAACARAGAGAVLRAWAGLGYNRRARHLHGAARRIVEHHGGTVPAELDALLALPGVGSYTARAVLVFAFERPEAVVDVNTRRVLCRAVAGRPLPAADAQRLADSLVPPGHPWHWNQGLMELGALFCTAGAPSCAPCPLRRWCAWRGAPGGPDPAGRRPAQSRFEGSDRQGRGRLVAALRAGPVRPSQLPGACGWPEDPARARRVADGLVADGLARRGRGNVLSLPTA